MGARLCYALGACDTSSTSSSATKATMAAKCASNTVQPTNATCYNGPPRDFWHH